ncbi:hypothetical protein CRM22_005117 [Opisthorchis felineus]|uniref:Uncharacterized protein n=1 Tax=Opisthorchis felineus TaxID=147828 RepID=A0A4S2LSQ1_OPIFE|nr:hypothetical protein CRM22_005117 [Opisthorchis felineus]
MSRCRFPFHMAWFGGGQPKTHIQEANKHLSELYKKVEELEEQLRIKTSELHQKEEDFTVAMQEVHEKRKLELQELNTLIYQQNLKLQRLERDMSSRESELTVLRRRCRMFDEVLRYKATLGKLTITLEQAEQYARLTANARNYTKDTQNSDDTVNTEPAPLMIRDVADVDDNDVPNGYVINGSSSPSNSEPRLLKLSGLR